MIFFFDFLKKSAFYPLFSFQVKLLPPDTLLIKNISNFATPKISEIVFIHYKQK